MLISSVQPRIYFENTSSAPGSDVRLFDVRYLNDRLTFSTLNDVGNAFQKFAILSVHNLGRVGVNVASPDNTFHVAGSVKIDDGTQANGYVFTSDANGVDSWKDPNTLVSDNDWTINGTHIYNANSGNVGIGSAAVPTTKFEVNSGTNRMNLMMQSSSSIGTWMVLSNTNSAGRIFQLISTGSGNGEGGGKLLFTRGANAGTVSGYFMVFDHSNLNVGIRTPNPVSSLDVAGSLGMKVNSGQVAGTNNPNASGVVWIYASGTGTVTLPAATTCENRKYVLVNNTGGALTVSSFIAIGGVATTTIGIGSSIEVISDGTDWYQIR